MFINYTDLYELREDSEGNQVEVLLKQNATIPLYIPRDDISMIKPHVTNSGRLYKNVSVVRVRGEMNYKVAGNYKTLIDRFRRTRGEDKVVKGFINEKREDS